MADHNPSLISTTAKHDTMSNLNKLIKIIQNLIQTAAKHDPSLISTIA